MTLTVTIPVRTWSITNQRVHWRERAKMAKAERDAAYLSVRSGSAPPNILMFWAGHRTTLDIRLTRIGPRRLDDDNLRGSLKSCRDGVADALGIDDGDSRLTWHYAQEKSKDYGVRVEITSDA